MYQGMCAYIAATNQKVSEHKWPSHQKNEKDGMGSWTVEKIGLAKDCLLKKYKLSNKGLGHIFNGRFECSQVSRFL